MRRPKLILSGVLFLAATTASIAAAQVTPMPDAVWDVMNMQQGPGSKGCVGCHIADAPVTDPKLGDLPYFGNDRAAVTQALEDVYALIGGRMGNLSNFLHGGYMPYLAAAGDRVRWETRDPDWDFFGTHDLCDGELRALDEWLILFETP